MKATARFLSKFDPVGQAVRLETGGKEAVEAGNAWRSELQVGRRGPQRALLGQEFVRPGDLARLDRLVRDIAGLGRETRGKAPRLRPDRASSWRRRRGRRASPASPPPRASSPAARRASRCRPATSSRARPGAGARFRWRSRARRAGRRRKAHPARRSGCRPARCSPRSRSRSRLRASRASRFFEASSAVTFAPASTSCAVLPPGAAQRSATRLAGDVAEQPRRQRRGGVLHPPFAFGETRQFGDVGGELLDAHAAGRQHDAAEPLGPELPDRTSR